MHDYQIFRSAHLALQGVPENERDDIQGPEDLDALYAALGEMAKDNPGVLG